MTSTQDNILSQISMSLTWQEVCCVHNTMMIVFVTVYLFIYFLRER